MLNEPVAMTGSDVKPAASRRAWQYLVAICGAVTVVRLSVLSAPTLRDEGMYGYIAQDVVRGFLPLSTALDNKGPALFYEWALALSLFGFSSIEGVRLLGTLFVLGSLLALFVLANDLGGERLALAAVALMAFHTSLAEMDGFYYATEFFVLLPSTLSVLWGWRAAQRGNARLALGAGLALAVAIWTRLTVVTLLPLLLWILWTRRDARFRLLAALGLGLGLVSAMFLTLYAWNGQLQVLLDCWVVFPRIQVLSRDTLVRESDNILEVVTIMAPQTVLLWGTFLLCLRKAPIKGQRGWFVAGWLALALVGFWVTRLYFPKQAFLFFPPLCLLSAAKLLELWQSQRKATGLFIGCCLLFTVAWNLPRHAGLMRGDPAATDVAFSKGESVAAWIKENTQPEQYVYNWGVEWQLYFRSERRAPTRQINALLFVMAALAVDGQPLEEFFVGMQREVVEGLELHRPEVIVLTAGLKNYQLAYFTLPAYIEELLLEKYELVFHDEPYWVFRRKPSPAGSVD